MMEHEDSVLVKALHAEPPNGLWSIHDASHPEVPEAVQAFLEHIALCEFEDSLHTYLGIEEEGVPSPSWPEALHLAVLNMANASFWAGVYAERNRVGL